MGDNLKAASQFVTESKRALDHLITVPSLNPSNTFDQLAELQRGAKIMHARAIYRAAQTAVDMMHKGRPQDMVQSELITVRGLVSQYENGLIEVLNETKPAQSEITAGPREVTKTAITSLDMQSDVQEKSFPVGDMIEDLNAQLAGAFTAAPAADTANDRPLDYTAPIASLTSLQPALDAAKQHLEPLIDFAPAAEQRDALRRLSRLYGQAQTAEAAAADTKQPASVEFESLMPELTNLVLTSARHAGKTVSISYAANNVRLGADMAEHLRPALIDLINVLINRSLEAPELRRARGESGAGHISIIADMSAGKIGVSLECTGREVGLEFCQTVNCQRLTELGAALEVNVKDERFGVQLSALPAYVHGRTYAAQGHMEQAS